MKIDEHTRTIMITRLNMSDEDIAKYERGFLTISKRDEKIIGSAKLTREIGREISDVAPILDKCDVFTANKSLFNISYKIGEMYEKGRLIFDDKKELMTKIDEHNIAAKMICECKNKVPRTWK